LSTANNNKQKQDKKILLKKNPNKLRLQKKARINPRRVRNGILKICAGPKIPTINDKKQRRPKHKRKRERERYSPRVKKRRIFVPLREQGRTRQDGAAIVPLSNA